MSDVAFEELTTTVVSLPYNEKISLLNSIAKSLYETTSVQPSNTTSKIQALNSIFGKLSKSDAEEIRNNRLNFREA
ncbi:MAG: hypothetical protein WCQ67_09470 [Treponema sp.]